jgi:nucleotide-binding universal stress UspA family protein
LRKIDREQLEKHRKSVAEDYLQQLTKKLNYNWAQVQTKVLVGKVAESIAEYAEKNSIDIILIASHGRSGVSRWVMGSVADRILRSACLPVLMVRAPGCSPGI